MASAGCDWSGDGFTSMLGSGMLSDRYAAVVLLVGVLCGSFAYENPILGSGFDTKHVWGLFFVLGDFRRVGAFGLMSSRHVVWTCSSKQVDWTVELSMLIRVAISISCKNVKWQTYKMYFVCGFFGKCSLQTV